jgi:hypothetical protein
MPAPEIIPSIPDTLSQKNATALAKRLDDYWVRQGYTTVRHWIEHERHVNGDGTKRNEGYWVVRSNLINGNPPPRAQQSQPKELADG